MRRQKERSRRKRNKEIGQGNQARLANIGNITKMKPGLTWLIVRGSAGVPGDTS
jgi:hypothetical protein